MDIPNYPNYWIDPCGNVYSRYTNKFLSQYTDKNGYKIVYLTNNKNKKNLKVHRLVALSYLDNPNNYAQVNHINGLRDDNRIENLEWCSHLYNCQSKNKIFCNIGCVYKRETKKEKWAFNITVNKKLIYYNCPSKCIAEAMRNIYIDLL